MLRLDCCLGIMAGLQVNPVWIKKFYGDRGGADGTLDNVSPALVGESLRAVLCRAYVLLLTQHLQVLRLRVYKSPPLQLLSFLAISATCLAANAVSDLVACCTSSRLSFKSLLQI